MNDDKIPVEYFERYLQHLEVERQNPSLEYLNQLISKQIQKFPFENISKLILFSKKNLTSLVDHETHLNNSVNFGLGGTCYACNYYFNQLICHLGFDAEIHGANMGKSIDVHLVNIIDLNGEKYLVDVGYGAPFYKAIKPFNEPTEIIYGELKHKISATKDFKSIVEVFKRNEKVHEYIVNKESRNINHFENIVKYSFKPVSEFMNKLRVIKFFEDSNIELNDFKVTRNEKNNSTSYFANNIDELCNIVKNEFKLPNLPIEEAYSILMRKRN